jgi:hypothetical protein
MQGFDLDWWLSAASDYPFSWIFLVDTQWGKGLEGRVMFEPRVGVEIPLEILNHFLKG